MATAGELKFVITVDNKGAVKNVKVISKETEKFKKQTDKANKSMGKFAKTVRRAFVAAGIAIAIKKTIEFNKEIALTATMMPGLDQEVENLKANVQGLAIQYGKTTTDLAKGAFLVVSAFGAQAAASQKLELTAKAAAAGNATTSDSLALLSAVTKGYGDISDEAFKKASDLSFMTVKLGQTSFPELAASIGKVVPVAAAMGVKQEELFAGFSTLTGVTGSAAEVTTQLAGIMRAFIKPTEGMRAALKKAKVETGEQMIAQFGLIGSMRKLIADTDGTSVSIGKLFRRAEALPAVFALTSGQAEIFDEKLQKIFESAGATDEAFNEIANGVNKAGFSLEQTKQAFVVFTQRIVDSTLQSTEFDDALKGLRSVFENKAFVGAIVMVTSALAKFLSVTLQAVAAIPELFAQANESMEKTVDQAKQWEENFKKTFAALREAGAGFDVLNAALESLDKTGRVAELSERSKELRDKIAELEKISKLAAPAVQDIYQAGIADRVKKLTIIEKERNDILSNQINFIVKNNEQFGISNEIIEKARGLLREQIKIQKEVTDEINKNTDSLNKNAAELTDVEKIAKRYGVGLKSATAIMQTQNPELAKLIELQNSLEISLEEATKLLPILNRLEKERKENQKNTKTELLDLPNLQDTINAGMREEIDLVPGLESVNLSVADFVEEQEKAAAATDKAAEKARKMKAGLDAIDRGLQLIARNEGIPERQKELFLGFGNVLKDIVKKDYIGAMAGSIRMLSSVLGETNAEFNKFTGIAEGLVSGNYIGAIASAASLAADILGPDGLTGSLTLAADALRELGDVGDEVIQRLADQFEELAQKVSQSEWLADPLGEWEKLQDEMSDAADEFKKTLPEAYEKAADAIGPLSDFLSQGAKTQDEFNSQVGITLGLFANMLKSGMSITEVLGAMGDSFDQLIATQEASGFAGDKTFEALKQFRTLIKDNEELVKSVEGFNKVLEITASLGPLTQKQLEDFGKSATAQFDKLIDAGFSSAQALTMLAPSLLTLKENAEKYGLELDANTQKLIDQAEKAGVFDEMADPLDTIADILLRIGEALGANLEEFNNMNTTVDDVSQKTQDEMGDVQAEVLKVGEAAADTSDIMKSSTHSATQSMEKDIEKLTGSSIDGMDDLAKAAGKAAGDMETSFIVSSKGSLDAINKFVGSASQSLGKLGLPIPGLGLPPGPGQDNIPQFGTGTPAGGFTVPRGFDNDDYLIGVGSGETVNVTPAGATNSESNFNLDITLAVDKDDSVDMVAQKVIEAIKLKKYGIDQAIREVV